MMTHKTIGTLRPPSALINARETGEARAPASWKRARAAGVGALVLLGLSACEGASVDNSELVKDVNGRMRRASQVKPDSVFGQDGLTLFGGAAAEDRSTGGVAVNAFLWRASLDTAAFMPLISADPFGGVIITDWYATPESPDERFKATIYILGRALRADGLKVSVFKQTRGPGGAWSDAPVAPEAAVGFEDAILTRARQLRIASRQ